MGVYVPNIKLPSTCIECPFLSKIELIYSPVKDEEGNKLYAKAAKCIFCKDGVESPYRKVGWLIKNKEKKCPLQEASDFGVVSLEDHEKMKREFAVEIQKLKGK